MFIYTESASASAHYILLPNLFSSCEGRDEWTKTPLHSRFALQRAPLQGPSSKLQHESSSSPTATELIHIYKMERKEVREAPDRTGQGAQVNCRHFAERTPATRCPRCPGAAERVGKASTRVGRRVRGAAEHAEVRPGREGGAGGSGCRAAAPGEAGIFLNERLPPRLAKPPHPPAGTRSGD